MQELYVTHLNLRYDKEELREEVNELDFLPFAPEQYYFRNTWLKARLRENIVMYPHIEDLHKQLEDKDKQLEGKDRIIESLLEIIKNQKEPASEPKASAIVQRTPVKFPEYDPNVDTLTKPMFSESDFKQPPEDTQKPGKAIYLPNLTESTQPEKTGSWQLEAFSEDGPLLSPDEAMIRYFKGRFPQRTPDMPDLLRYLEESGFPHTRDAASTRLAKLRRKQRAARESGAL